MTGEPCKHEPTTGPNGNGVWCRVCGEKMPDAPGYEPRHLVPGQSSQVDVESEILRLSAKLEHATDDLAALLQTEAGAEVAHKRAMAKAMLEATGSTVSEREAQSILKCVDQLLDRRISEALASAQKELCHSLRAQLSALQTLAANIRAQV